MKDLIKKIIFPIVFIAHTVVSDETISLPSDVMPFNMQNKGFGLPPMPQGQMPAPKSIDEAFAGFSQEEIIQQVQEVQKVFESLSKEEQDALLRMADAAFAQMPQEERESIEALATMIDPFIEKPQQTPIENKPEVKTADTKKTKDEPTSKSIDTDEVESLNSMLKDLHQQIDEIMQKAESSKETAEYINHKWSKRLTFNNMTRQLFKLQDKRLLKKLADKDNPNKELHQKLIQRIQKFHTDVASANRKLQIDDSFGLPESRKVESNYANQLKQILTTFESHMDNIMSPLQDFFAKHDPEALELAKEYESKSKSAQDHAKDSYVKRGSAPALPTSTSSSGYNSSSSPFGSSNYYPDYYGSGYPQQYPSGQKDSEMPDMQQGSKSKSGSDSAAADKKKDDKKDDKGKKEETKEDKEAQKAYDKITDAFGDYEATFNNKHALDVVGFFNNTLANYPSATDPKQPGNRDEESNWLYSRSNPDKWIYSRDDLRNKGFKHYADEVKIGLSKHDFLSEVHAMKKSIEELSSNIHNLSKEQLQNLSKNQTLQTLKKRVADYQQAYDNASSKIEAQFTKNADNGTNAQPDLGLHDPMMVKTYTELHNDFANFLKEKIQSPLQELSASVKNIDGKIKRHINKVTAAESKNKK